MVEDYRLKKHLEKKYYNVLFRLVETELNKEFNRVTDHVFLKEVSINTVWFAHKGVDTFYCSLYEDAIINDYDDYKEDGSVKRFFVKCEGRISNKGIDLYSFKVEEEPTNYPYLMKNSFMPIFKKEEYDNIARDFIHKYCPSFVGTGSINVNEIMQKLDLELKVLSLRGYGDIYGMIAFDDMNVDTYTEGGSLVPANTIVLNSDRRSIFSDNQSKDLFTVVHECVHKELHYKHYLFNKQFNSSSETAIKCETTGVYNEDENIREMEKQANAIASKILLPEMKLLSSIEAYKNSHNLINANDYYDLLERLKEEFKVSYSALKIRLIQLGYTEFVGIREYMDEEMVRPYISTTKLESDESYTIKPIDFIRLACTDVKLKRILDKGKFVYIEGHVCLDNPKYIVSVNDEYAMSDYALNHMDECCLKFQYTFKSKYKDFDNTYLFLCRLDSSIIPTVKFMDSTIHEETTDYGKSDWQEKNKYVLEFKSKMTNCLGDNLRAILKEQGLTYENAAYDCRVDKSTIESIIYGKQPKPKKITLLKICIGLNIDPSISEELFECAGYNLRDCTEETMLIKQLLYYFPKCGVDKVESIYFDHLKKESE